MLEEVFVETLQRTAGLAIVIVTLLLVVEYLNHKFGDKILHFLKKRSTFLSFWAALFALLPGCNAAAATSVLYSRGYLTIGPLVAAMIATSDEAIYVFIPERFNFLPLYIAKFTIAIITGYGVDLFLKKSAQKRGETEVEYCCSIHSHEHAHDFPGMIKHTLRHAVKIILIIFTVLFLFNFAKDSAGFDDIASGVIGSSQVQPLLAGLFGLIPGCGTSVVLATLYTQGILTFGAAVAGLSAASGDTLLVLLANKVERKNVLVIMGIVLGASLIGGYLTNIITSNAGR